MQIFAHKDSYSLSTIEQTPIHRDWMDETFDRHAYQCFPVSLANRLGWSISFSEDISFINKQSEENKNNYVDILSGGEFVSNRRANNTVSLDTGITFYGDGNLSLLTIPPPNIFIDGVQCISTIISTSALVGQFPIALMVTRKDEVIKIPSGTPLATIIPISLKEINSMELVIKQNLPESMMNDGWSSYMEERAKVSEDLNSRGEWTHFYRDAVDHNGDKFGEHEVKKIIMKVTDE